MFQYQVQRIFESRRNLSRRGACEGAARGDYTTLAAEARLAAPLPVVLQAKTGTTTTLYLFDLGTRPLAEYDAACEYLLPDGLGSVRQIADASGNVKLSEAYEPCCFFLRRRAAVAPFDNSMIE